MAAPKVQERLGANGSTVNGTADRPFQRGCDRRTATAACRAGARQCGLVNGDEYTTDPHYGVDRVTYLTTEPHKAALASFKDTVAALRGHVHGANSQCACQTRSDKPCHRTTSSGTRNTSFRTWPYCRRHSCPANYCPAPTG